jgi:hypothetical protein
MTATLKTGIVLLFSMMITMLRAAVRVISVVIPAVTATQRRARTVNATNTGLSTMTFVANLSVTTLNRVQNVKINTKLVFKQLITILILRSHYYITTIS